MEQTPKTSENRCKMGVKWLKTIFVVHLASLVPPECLSVRSLECLFSTIQYRLTVFHVISIKHEVWQSILLGMSHQCIALGQMSRDVNHWKSKIIMIQHFESDDGHISNGFVQKVPTAWSNVIHPMISVYLCGIGGMGHWPNSPQAWNQLNRCNFQRFYLNKYSHRIKTRTPEVGPVCCEPTQPSASWVLGPQDPPYWELCKFPMAMGSCYNPTRWNCHRIS